MVETVLAPAHPDPFEPLLNQRRCSTGVDSVLDRAPKLVAIDEEADHQIVHGRRLGEANRGLFGIRVYLVHEIYTFISSTWLCRAKSANEWAVADFMAFSST